MLNVNISIMDVSMVVMVNVIDMKEKWENATNAGILVKEKRSVIYSWRQKHEVYI